jgi:hypothetical protein
MDGPRDFNEGLTRFRETINAGRTEQEISHCDRPNFEGKKKEVRLAGKPLLFQASSLYSRGQFSLYLPNPARTI